ncbi:hypothetical protein [Marinomonas polaris]|uniref:hypothetical protein n=1 Tax=Marinomonas polaris TaxID=293552 RepID=UPI003F9AFF63
MKTGFVMYASSVSRLSDFYSHVFALNKVEGDNSYALLADGDFELVLLETEASKTVSDLHSPRASTPIKPTFFINTSLEIISEMIKNKGGSVFPPKNWEFGGRKVCDAHDCEGNIFQLRIDQDA